MILTITPNPALDVTGEVDEIVPNEKTYVQGEQRHAGGNGINAARVIAALGFPVIATGFVGGATGAEVRSHLDEEGVAHDFVEISGQTRVNVTIMSRATAKQTRLSFPGPKVSARDVAELIHRIEKCDNLSLVNIGGSFPPGFGDREFTEVMAAINKKERSPVVDVPTRQMKEAIFMGPLMIKPNLHEFQELIGKKVESVAQVARELTPLHSYVPLICVSSVEGGVLFGTKDGVWFAKGPRVKARSSVGAGDSMVGAMMTQLHRAGIVNRDTVRHLSEDVIASMLRMGLGASMATVERPGTEVGDKSAIENHSASILVERVVNP